jgi:glutathione reductase (NADPH)
MNYDFDLFIIGAGPAGLAAAKRAAQQGVKVAIAEQNHLGGCCVNRGCIPKKLMVYAADYAAALHNATEYGWESCASQFHWQKFLGKRDQEVQRLREVQEQALEKAGVEQIKGHTKFLDAHTLVVEDQKYKAKQVLIAVGGKPMKPDIPGIEYALTSDELLNIEHLPNRIAIIGGGYIGIEFASVLRGFGCDVAVVSREDMILGGFDDELRSAVQEGLTQRGIKIFSDTSPDKITKTPEGLCVQLAGDSIEPLIADVVLCATGRSPNLETLELEKAGVEFDQKAIAVNPQSCTNQPHIYAVGDCTNRLQLTPVARAEGQAAVDIMLGKPSQEVDYTLVPSAVLSRPEAASIGLSEAQAKEKYGDVVECHRQDFVPLRYTLGEQKQQGFIKLVVNGKTDRILGIHMVGESAEEVVQCGVIALQKGATRKELMEAIAIHPSAAEELFSV